MVLQRWQNLMLLIASVMMWLFTFLSLGQYQGATQTVNFTTMGMVVEGTGASFMQTIYLFIVSCLSALLPLIALFKFKNLKAQRTISRISLLLVLATMVCAWAIAQSADVAGSQGISWSSIVIAPFIAIVALIIAGRCIGGDIKKLSSYDRLR